MELDDAYTLIASAIDSGHAANGYLVAGDLFRCEQLVKRILLKLFPDAVAQVESGCHPDVVRLEPSGRSRTIKVAKTDSDPSPGMRDAIVEPMSVTAFSGGWKVGVIVGADRMQPAAANAFLKLLEEPPPKTMFLLTTDSPDMLLPTIVSRTQRVDLRLSAGLLAEADRAEIDEIFSASGIRGTYAKSQAAKTLAEVYEDLKTRTEEGDGDLAAMRKSFFKTILSDVRQWMIGERLPEFQVFHDLNAVEEAYRQAERSMTIDAVLSFMCDRMFFPIVNDLKESSL